MVAVCRHILLSSALLLAGSGCAQSGLRTSPPVHDRAQAERCNDEGLALVCEGHFDAAVLAFQKALDADPFYGPAHCNLGVALLHAGRLYDACWHLDVSRRLMPYASQVRVDLGLLYDSVGKYAEAEEELRAALALAPDDIEIMGHLARVHIRQRKVTSETLCWLDQLASRDDDATWRDWARRQLTQTSSIQHEEIGAARCP